MNVTFHTLTAMAVTSAIAAKQSPRESWLGRRSLLWCGTGFVAATLLHGVLDVLPHQYPFRPRVDVAIALLLYALFAGVIRWRLLPLWSACFVGCVFPDLVDLGPRIVNRYLGTQLPVCWFFPCHWPAYSGSIFDGSRSGISLLNHVLVVSASLSTMAVFRKTTWRTGRSRAGELPSTKPRELLVETFARSD